MDKGNFLKYFFKDMLWSLLPVMLLFAFWELISRNNFINSTYFPPPSEIMERFIYLVFNRPAFLKDIWFSLHRFITASIISVPPAVILGILIGLNKYVELVSKYFIAIIYPMPKLAVFPFFLLIFGIGDASKIALIMIGIFFLVLLSTIHATQRIIAQGYLEIAFIYKVPFLRKVFDILIKGALPEILNGIKIGLGYGLVMVVAGEFTVSRNGIGFFIWNAWDQFRIKDLYCGLIVLAFLGVVIFSTFDKIKAGLKWGSADNF